MIQAVIFDMDGLMLDTERLTQKVWHQVGEEMGYPQAEKMMSKAMGVRSDMTQRIFLEHFGQDFPFDIFVKKSKKLTDSFIEKNGVPVKEGLFELLRYLRSAHIPAAVATSTSRVRAMDYLGRARLTGFFDKIICGDMVQKSKPDPDIYLTAARAVGMTPNGCMALEDSLIGCKSALAAGMKTVMVPDLVQPEEELRARLFACVPSLRDVIPLLDSYRPEEGKM